MTTEENTNEPNPMPLTKEKILNATKISRFINSRQSKQTRKKYQSFIHHFFNFINIHPDTYFINDYEYLEGNTKKDTAKQYRKDLEDYKIFLINNPHKYHSYHVPSSNRTRLSCIRSLFTYNEIELPTAFWKQLNDFKNIRTGEKETPSAEQIAKILQHTDLQGKTIFIIMATTGSRISSVRKLKRKDVDLSRHYPKITLRGENAKNKKTKIKRTTPEGKKIIEEYIKHHDYKPEEYLFPKTIKVNKKWVKDYSQPTTKENVEYKWKHALNKAKLYKKDETTRQATMTTQSLKRFFRTQGSKGNEGLAKYFSEHNDLDERYKDLPDKDMDDEYAKMANNLLIYEKPHDTDERIIELKKQLEESNGKIKFLIDSNKEKTKKQQESENRLERAIKNIEDFFKMDFNQPFRMEQAKDGTLIMIKYHPNTGIPIILKETDTKLNKEDKTIFKQWRKAILEHNITLYHTRQ